MMNSLVFSRSLEQYETSYKMPFALALGFHIFLLMWDPTILKASNYQFATPVITVKVMDHLPVIEQPKPQPKPVVHKEVGRKPAHKAKKSGLSLTRHPQPIPIVRHHLIPKAAPVAPRPFVSKIDMPKFVPHESDEPIAASPLPGPAPAAAHRVASASMGAPIKLHGKSRGVRAQDIPFELADREGISAGGAVVAIPVGQERGDIASLPSAQIHEAPKGRVGRPGYKYGPGLSSGYGELMGHDKSGKVGFHGAVVAETYTEGSLGGVSGNGKGGKVVAGKGFEIGGPVGDRRITRRKLPQYPDWAEEKGISAMIKIYFTVRPDGTIRTTMRVLQSSGYPELDDIARAALAQWRFSETSADSSESAAWGVITFRFSLA